MTTSPTKKLKQLSKENGPKSSPEKGIVDEEKKEVVQRKVKRKQRSSKTTSKYFEENSPLREGTDKQGTVAPLTLVKKEQEEQDDEDSDDEDWEEVEELSEPLGPLALAEPTLSAQPVEIEIETPDIIHKKQRREKRKAEFETYLRRMVNRFNKDLVLDTHKVHLMCLIANGMFRNRLCSEVDLLAVALSLLPTHFAMVNKEKIDHGYISGLLKWFQATFTLNSELPCEENPDPRALLERRLGSLSAKNHQEMTHLFLLFLRSLQLFCRLVFSLQPLSLKLPPVKKNATSACSPPGKTEPKDCPSSNTKVSPVTKRPASGRQKGEKVGKKAKTTDGRKDKGNEKTSVAKSGQKPKNTKRRSIASKVSYKEDSSEGEALSDGDEFLLTSEEESEDSESWAKNRTGKKGKGKSKAKANKTTRNTTGGEGKTKLEEEEVSEEELENKRESLRALRKKKEEAGTDEWVEVYLEKTGCWVCVDVQHGIAQPQLCSQNATVPLTYVVSVDGEGHVKDLGRKYDPTWMTSSRKRRVDEEWWEETLEPFLGSETDRDLQEDKELQAKLLDKPLPTSVAEFKNHPLYALKRHLLKYEAVYPLTAAVMGYCRGEPVYSRDCIHTLHSRDTWLKEARTVRLGEEPYKMVRGFSNRSRKARVASEKKDKDDLPLFGEWQTEEYQPPIAVDGKVPRNDYGNVYLFKPCMLPVGCVHLRLPNLNRVAKKLCIDCAASVTGFDFHGGYSHAVTDGYIVCEEHEEVLRAAWVEDQEIQKQREKEKREKKAVSNWTLLVQGLLIRERLQKRYGKKGPMAGGAEGLAQLQAKDGEGGGFLSSDEDGDVAAGGDVKTAAPTLAQSWPQNRQEEPDGGNSRRVKKKISKQERGQAKNMFPFEKV
ncbi:DNA repair protein complementing XP-C cells [Aplochiton taeniatus]